jgi:hypothetical protein
MNQYSKEIRNITTIDALQTYHYKKIINLSYIVILGRYADSAAVEHLIQEFSNGFTVKEMQDNLRVSDEYKTYQKNKKDHPSKIIMYLTEKNVALDKVTQQGKNIYFQLKSCTEKLEG